MLRSVLAIAIVIVGVNLAVPSTWAQPQSVQYGAGWNMVGGTPGTNFTAAQALYVYQNGGYSAPSSSTSVACQGYWAYYSISTAVSLSPTTAGTQTCSLRPGWNMIGNPFDQVVSLPSTATGYWWDPSSSAYAMATTIPVGGAVWVYTADTASLLLQVGSPNQNSVTITVPPVPSGPIQLHVGDDLTLVAPLSSAMQGWVARSDPAFLQLISSGPVTGTSTSAFHWRAIAAGNTEIDVSPPCNVPACTVIVMRISVTILP